MLPGPDQETLKDLTPEGVAEHVALYAWREGWMDGLSGNDYRVLQDNPEFQPLYSDGFETAEAEKAVQDEFSRTRQDAEGKLKKVKKVDQPKPPVHLLYIRRSLNFCEDKRFAFQGFCYLAVGMLAAQMLVERGLGLRR